jgi:hypothetical protein
MVRDIRAKKFKRRQTDFEEDSHNCLSVAQGFMPYGTGYLYIKNMASFKFKLH